MNKGARALRTELEAKGRGSSTELAEKLDVGPDAVSRWCKGEHTPVARYRLKIHALFPKVAPLLWDELEDGSAEPSGPAAAE